MLIKESLIWLDIDNTLYVNWVRILHYASFSLRNIYVYIFMYFKYKDCSYPTEARIQGYMASATIVFISVSHEIPVQARESLNNGMSLYSKFNPPTCIRLFVISAASSDTRECWIKQTFQYGRSVLPETGGCFNITLDVSYLDFTKSRWCDNSV